MKNSSQTQHCKSKIRRKEEQDVKKNGPCRSAFATATVHPASTVPPAACSPAFSRLGFLLQFLVSSDINPCNSFSFSFFFCNFIYTEHLYKPQSVQTQLNFTSRHVGNTVSGRQFRRCFLFSFSSTFFPFLFHFLGCQTLL